MVVSWPAVIREGFETDCLVEFSDFYPTFAEAARLEVPDTLDGKSFYPLLAGEDYTPRETVFVHNDPKMKMWGIMKAGRFVRTKTHKLYYDGRFLDVEKDPLELKPLDTEQLTENEAKIYQKLKKEMDAAPEWIYVDENFKGDLKR
jgi:arylsulfatase A